MPLKTHGGPFFTASVIRFILHSLGSVYMQSHIWSWLCLCHLPSPHPSQLPQLEQWELNSLVVKREQTRHRFPPAWWREGGLEQEERQMYRRQNLLCVQMPNCRTGQQDFSRETCLTVNSAHTATQNAALCKSSVNAFTFHSCSYFKQA